jgi:3-hydroxyacyl-[acyl-carrier-protein] dehydratase
MRGGLLFAVPGSSGGDRSASGSISFAAPLGAIDSVETSTAEGRLRIHATKRFDSQSGYLAGHFPEFAVFPGVFIVESLLQAVAYALRDSIDRPPELLEVSSVRFFIPILLGDEFSLDTDIVNVEGGFLAEALCSKGEVVCARLKARFQYGA